MKKLSMIIILITLLCLAIMPLSNAYAADDGKLTVLLRYGSGDSNAVNGCIVKIWRVADSMLDPETDLSEPATAPTAQGTATAGKVVFSGLEHGVYLVIAKDTRNPVQYVFTHFVVLVKSGDADGVTAIPKSTYTPPPVSPPGGDSDPDPKKPPKGDDENKPPINGGNGGLPPPPPPVLDDNGAPLGEWRWDPDLNKWVFDEYPPLAIIDLPQTGTLKWPVPAFAGAGILLVAAGYFINRRKPQLTVPVDNLPEKE